MQTSTNLPLIQTHTPLLESLIALVEYIENENPGAALGGDAYVSGLRDQAHAAIAKAREEA